MQGVEFSIVNNGRGEVEPHTVNCMIFAIWNAKAVGFHRSGIPAPTVIEKGLLGGGRGETADCATLVGFEKNVPMLCVDIGVVVKFSIKGQSQEKMTKPYRFSYDIERTQRWVPQSLQSPLDFCEKYYRRAATGEPMTTLRVQEQ